ncbi:MAG: ABC transporter permease, partial [Gammaproteobacteria bacterium]|nr:ABC transporter permease [Gammaproteobacteria bacterium]
ISNSYANVVASFYSSKFQHNIEELLIAPIPNFIILAGYVGGGVARGVVVGVVVTLVSMFFTDLNIHSYGVTLAVFVLTSVLFSTAGFINAVYANSFDDISIVPTFVLTPLTYLGGVFYSISMLSPFWQTASLANPVLYMVNAFRYGLLGVSDIAMWQAFAIILGFVIALGAFAMWLLSRGVGIKS